MFGTDNILIAALEKNGVQTVGKYANYTLITETLNTIMGIVTNALTPSIGNLNAESDEKKKESIFNTTLFVCAWGYGFICAGIMALSERFISIWVGDKYVLGNLIVFSIISQLYVRGVHYAAYTYRVTSGLFVQSKYVPILTTTINLVLSIYFGKMWGLFGILIATSIARIVTIGISDPVLVYKNVFKRNPIIYYGRYITYLILVVISYFAGAVTIKFIPLSGWSGFIISGIAFSVVFNLIFMLCVLKTKEFKYMKQMASRILGKVFRR